MYRPPKWLRLFLLSLVVAGSIVVTIAEMSADPRRISGLIDDLGPLVSIAFILTHVLASLFFVPRSVLAIAASTLFGLWGAVLWSTLGSVGGAVAGFLLARYLNAGWLVPEEMQTVGPLLRRAETGGWRAVAIVRLIPILPHALTNYGLGLTQLRLLPYAFGSLVGMLPETYVFVRLGVSGRRALESGAWIEPLLWGAALIALSFVVPRLFRRQQP
jgi:uncharacterized membrane protein YdjX (TVP38/TMEM64 family)